MKSKAEKVFTLVMFLLLVSIATAADFDPLGKKVKHIFVPQGEMVVVMPEFIRQLEVPAILEIGPIPAMIYEHDNGYFPSKELEPARMIGPYERESGTVLEIVDEFCRLRQDVMWEVRNDILCIFQGPREDTLLTKLLETQLGNLNFEGDLFDDFPEEVVDKFKAVIPPREVLSMPDWGRMGLDKAKPDSIYQLVPLNRKVSFQIKQANLRMLMEEVLRQKPTYFWVAIEAEKHAKWSRKGYGVYLSNWNPQRNSRSLDELLLGLNEDAKLTHGYVDPFIRIDDFKKELRRRHHFDPASFRHALKKLGVIKRAIGYDFIYDSTDELQWLMSLGDEKIASKVTEEILQCKDRQRRCDLVTYLVPSPEERMDLIPFWEKLAREDKDPELRDEAAAALKDAGSEYQEWLKKMRQGKNPYDM